MKHILLIEDNKDVRENTAEILELANYTVTQAENGKQGVEFAQKNRPDLIICDIMMPVLDGYGVIHLLNKNPVTASIPFIFLTAKSERLDFRKGMEMGADDYITKPFDDIELLKAVESRIYKSEVLKAEFSKNTEGLNNFFDQVNKIDELKKLSAERRFKMYKKKEIVFNEIALFKLATPLGGTPLDIKEINLDWNAKVVHWGLDYVVIEKNGTETEIAEFYQYMKNWEILEYLKSGRVAVGKTEKGLVEYLPESDWEVV